MRRELPMMLVRTAVALIFLLEGSLQFLAPPEPGAGDFAAIGLPLASVLAPAAGGVEIAAGAAVLVNLYAGDASLALMAVVLTALLTKIPILLGRPMGFLTLAKVSRYGWLGFFHEARLDLAMLLCLAAILVDSGLQVGRRRRPWYQSKGL